MTAKEQSVSGMPGRYATALFELAQQEEAVEDVGEALLRFANLVEQSPDLMRLVRNPVFSADDQIRALNAVLERAAISGLAAKLVLLAAQNRRLYAILDMIGAYQALRAEAKGETTAEVASAEPLSNSQVQALKDELARLLGRSISLTAKVDPAILGGLVVKAGSRMVDSSLRTKLNNLKTAMKGTA
ncbi:MAG TPA: F0F1 ATP synthase subunit delta [Aestuariivirgaceae bacterium]|nr:F0F1 ATP synthase subunit delta [Aestuariivirgaceae bacterium]